MAEVDNHTEQAIPEQESILTVLFTEDELQ